LDDLEFERFLTLSLLERVSFDLSLFKNLSAIELPLYLLFEMQADMESDRGAIALAKRFRCRST